MEKELPGAPKVDLFWGLPSELLQDQVDSSSLSLNDVHMSAHLARALGLGDRAWDTASQTSWGAQFREHGGRGSPETTPPGAGSPSRGVRKSNGHVARTGKQDPLQKVHRTHFTGGKH